MAAAVQDNGAAADLEAAFRSIDAAVAKQDQAAFANALGDRFTFVGIDGAMLDRKEALDRQRAGKLLAGTPNEIIKTQVFGDMALVTYKTKIPVGTLVGTRVFLKQGGAWKWVYSQGSIVTAIPRK